jgi:cell division protein FtsL
MRPTSILWLAVILMTGVAVFSVKAAVAGLEEELLRVRKEIARDHEAIHVLNAEWSYLNQPTRLADLAKRHLPQLQPIATVQYGDMGRLELLPWRAGEEAAETAPPPAPATAAAVASARPLPAPIAKPGEKRSR